MGGKAGLQPVQKTIIDRCVRLVYNEYLNDPKPENMPILEDLYNLLREQEEKEAQYIACLLYTSGYGKARRIKYREIKYSKTKYLWIKYRFHSLPGLRGTNCVSRPCKRQPNVKGFLGGGTVQK